MLRIWPLDLLANIRLGWKWLLGITLWYYSTFDKGLSLLWSTFVFTCHFGAKTILSRSHFEDDSSPHFSGSGSLIWIDLTFVLFKHVILIWINYLETWLCSDITSCYYTRDKHSSLLVDSVRYDEKLFFSAKMKKKAKLLKSGLIKNSIFCSFKEYSFFLSHSLSLYYYYFFFWKWFFFALKLITEPLL